jgi:hypothetical protein
MLAEDHVEAGRCVEPQTANNVPRECHQVLEVDGVLVVVPLGEEGLVVVVEQRDVRKEGLPKAHHGRQGEPHGASQARLATRWGRPPRTMKYFGSQSVSGAQTTKRAKGATSLLQEGQVHCMRGCIAHLCLKYT